MHSQIASRAARWSFEFSNCEESQWAARRSAFKALDQHQRPAPRNRMKISVTLAGLALLTVAGLASTEFVAPQGGRPANLVKRSLCNTFGGCGVKRSLMPKLAGGVRATASNFRFGSGSGSEIGNDAQGLGGGERLSLCNTLGSCVPCEVFGGCITKRSLCNTFGGCGVKRSLAPILAGSATFNPLPGSGSDAEQPMNPRLVAQILDDIVEQLQRDQNYKQSKYALPHGPEPTGDGTSQPMQQLDNSSASRQRNSLPNNFRKDDEADFSGRIYK